MRVTAVIILFVLPALPVLGNEALDLLEGKEDPLEPLGHVLTPQPDASQPNGLNWDQDFSWRWLTQLPPLWSDFCARTE